MAGGGAPPSPARKLIISVDVEEEGLFTGRYPVRPPGVNNVRHLERLEFISRDLGYPLTLLPTYPVVQDAEASAVLERWKELYGAEIGVHLHAWNTPPFDPAGPDEPVRACHMPRDLLRNKFTTIVDAVSARWGERPQVFRMGRFDFGAEVLEMLESFSFQADGSVVPLRVVRGTTRQGFLSPADPYRHSSLISGKAGLWELPLTMVPLSPVLVDWVWRAAERLPAPCGDALLAAFRRVGATGTQPSWFPLASMRAAARLHTSRGGSVIHMFLHSSELMAGGTPACPTEGHVDRLTAKIRTFLGWLRRRVPLEGVTMSGYCRSCRPPAAREGGT